MFITNKNLLGERYAKSGNFETLVLLNFYDICDNTLMFWDMF